MTGATSSKWSLKRINIFKQKKQSLLNDHRHHHDPSSSSSPIEEPDEDDFPLFEFEDCPFDRSTPVKQFDNTNTSSNSKLTLPLSRTSKATVATASTTLSTVNTQSYSPSFTLSSSYQERGGAFKASSGANNNNTADEFSYSCANSTAWTCTPPPPVNRGKSLYYENGGSRGDARSGVVGMRNKTSSNNGGESLKEMMDKKEEKDGFVELITERQRSRRYSEAESAPSRTTDNNITTSALSTSKNAMDSSKTEQGYFAQGYNLMGFHQDNNENNLFQQHSTSISPGAEGSQQTGSSQAVRTASTVSKTNVMTSTHTSAAAILEIKKSDSPDDPPNTQRKSVNPEFFMEDAAVPPSPTNKHRQRQHTSIQQNQQKLQQQQQRQAQQPNHEDYDNPNHLYAEINVKHRHPQPMSRQGSEGTASLAMTSISSITGHGSLFNKDYDDHNNSNILSPLPGGLWRIGSTVINTVTNAAAEENYFDYSNDETLRNHHRGIGDGNNLGILERIGNAAYQLFSTTCECFDVHGNNVPVSPGVVVKEDSDVLESKMLNDTTVNGKNKGDGRESSSGGSGEQQPMFSSPMDN